MGTRAWVALVAAAMVAALAAAGGTQRATAAPTPDCHDSLVCVNQSLDQVVVNGCNGEGVHVTGTWHVMLKETVGSDGTDRLSIDQNFQQTTGIGLVTGALYNVDDQLHVTDIVPPTIFPFESDVDEHYNVISTKPAQAPNFLLHSRVRIIFTLSGPQAKLDDLDTKCTG